MSETATVLTQLTAGAPPLALEGALAFIQSQLALVFPPTLFDFAVIPPRMTTAAWNKVFRRLSFVGIGWNGLNDKGSTMQMFSGVSEFSVVLAVKNTSSVRARYVGDERGIGIMPMVRATVGVLHGATCPGVGSFQVTSAEPGYAEELADDDVLMALVHVSNKISLPLGAQIGALPETTITQLGIDWLIDGGASIATTEDYP